MPSFPQKLILLAIVIFAGLIFFTGIDWGLPSRDSDQYLFGDRVPWTGQQIMNLAGAWDTSDSRGADIAMHPLHGRDQPIVLNDTDARRAEIVRRYRLYSSQPDEMITFRSLSGMKPARLNFDPKMYQYGGLWLYPIGALLKLGAMSHLITLRTDLAFYLEHPDAFARFYLVARGYSAAWGLLGVLAVYAVGRECSGRFSTGAAAAALYASMPVVIDLAHEAKPHLAGTVLTLLTVLAGMRYVRTGRRKWWMTAGLFAGAAVGMVLTGYAAFAVLPVMTLLRPMSAKQRLQVTIKATLIGIAIFTLTNPYPIFNMLFHRSVLHSNVGNYGTFYRPAISLTGLKTAARSILEGISFAPLLLGLLVIIRRRSVDILLASVAVPVLLQFVLLANGKTAEYARFALTVDVVFALFAALFIDRLPITGREKNLAAALAVAGTLFFGIRYEINFVLDNRSDSTRRSASRSLESSTRLTNTLAVSAEPAPYCLPPVNLFDWQITLQPIGSSSLNSATRVGPVDFPKIVDPLAPPRILSPISWANKPFEIFTTAPVSSQPMAH